MATAFGAYPEQRHPFEPSPIHADGGKTVLYADRTITLTETGGGDTLLISPEDLTRINGFELKPEGACYGPLCVPLGNDVLIHREGKQWVDLTAFADLLGQPYVSDADANVWSFSEIPANRENMLVDGLAPDFEVTDRQGNVVRMADLKGKKALIVTWS